MNTKQLLIMCTLGASIFSVQGKKKITNISKVFKPVVYKNKVLKNISPIFFEIKPKKRTVTSKYNEAYGLIKSNETYIKNRDSNLRSVYHHCKIGFGGILGSLACFSLAWKTKDFSSLLTAPLGWYIGKWSTLPFLDAYFEWVDNRKDKERQQSKIANFFKKNNV